MSTITRGKSVLTSATGAFKQGQDVTAAEQKIAMIQEELAALEKQAQEEIDRITASYDPAVLKLETETLKPTRTDVKVELVALLWLPYDAARHPAW
jgi:phage host-nuclease inhibitor protein Gam